MLKIFQRFFIDVFIVNIIELLKSTKIFFQFFINTPKNAFSFSFEGYEIEIVKIKKFINTILVWIILVASFREILGTDYNFITEVFDQLIVFIFYFIGLAIVFIFLLLSYKFSKKINIDKTHYFFQNIYFYNLVFLLSILFNIFNIGLELEKQSFSVVIVPTIILSVYFEFKFFHKYLNQKIFISFFHFLIVLFLQMMFTVFMKELLYNKVSQI